VRDPNANRVALLFCAKTRSCVEDALDPHGYSTAVFPQRLNMQIATRDERYSMELDLEALTPLIFSYTVNLVSAILILVIGWNFAAWLGRFLRRKLGQSSRIDPTLAPMVAGTARYLALIVVLIPVLAQFGIQTASVLAVLGAAGLAIGLALQGTLSNVASGVMLLILRPFGAGDYIDASGVSGTVLEIGLFATRLETFDGIYVMVPNT
jgi:small conductance mechanosensitive channel